jgi:hypothetical protein
VASNARVGMETAHARFVCGAASRRRARSKRYASIACAKILVRNTNAARHTAQEMRAFDLDTEKSRAL